MTLLAAVLAGVAAAVGVGAWLGLRWPVGGARAGARDRAVRWMAEAGVAVGPAGAAAGTGLLAGAVMAALWTLTTSPAVALPPALAAAALPWLRMARRRRDRLERLQRAWPEGLRELLAGMRAGRSLHQAICALVRHGPPALREGLARYPALAEVEGAGPALQAVRRELADPTSDHVLEVLGVAHSRGGPVVADVLAELADHVEADLRAREEAETEATEQRLNAKAVLVMPWAVLVVLTLRPGHFRDFYASADGVVVVALGAVISLLGAVVALRLARQPTPPRVLAGPTAAGGRHDDPVTGGAVQRPVAEVRR